MYEDGVICDCMTKIPSMYRATGLFLSCMVINGQEYRHEFTLF